MQTAKRMQTIQWGSSIISAEITGYERKPLPDLSQAWKREQINCLPTIAKLAKDGIISLYSYPELRHEKWKRPGSFPVNRIGNVFSDVPISPVDAAVERSYFIQKEIGQYIKTEEVISFC